MKRHTIAILMNCLVLAAIGKLALTIIFLLSGTGEPARVEAAGKGQTAPSTVGVKMNECSPEFMELLNTRAQELDARQRQLDAKEQDLKLLEQEIDQKIKLLRKLQRQLEGPIKQRAADEELRLQHLAGVYGSMEPARAAALLNKLDDATVTKLFSIMKSKKVAAILANMEPDKAARISRYLYRDTPR